MQVIAKIKCTYIVKIIIIIYRMFLHYTLSQRYYTVHWNIVFVKQLWQFIRGWFSKTHWTLTSIKYHYILFYLDIFKYRKLKKM